MNRLVAVVLAVVAVLLIGGVTAWVATAPDQTDRTAAGPQQATHEGLHATVWTQTAAEYRAAALQAYRAARVALDAALEDPAWSASLEQLEAGDFAELAPAVILDVDETVLDNAAYQARLMLDDEEFETEGWHRWVREEKAVPVPGALEFTTYAAERGAVVFYVTNRRHEVEESTRANLLAHGFPMAADIDVLLTRDERPDWSSDKGSRRRHVGAAHRIVMMVGDNLGDFLSGIEATPAERAAMVDRHRDLWGSRWIVLPNPQYGSWEGSLIGFDFGLSVDEKRRIKFDALEPAR